MIRIGNFSRLMALALIPAAAMVLPSCKGKEKDSKTGWNYNDPKNGGFEVSKYIEQKTGPGLVLIEGGRFTMGQTEQNIGMEMDNIPRTVTVQSFYMDETEVSNKNYRMYTWWLYKVFGADQATLPIYKGALPDTLVWRRNLSYNEPYVEMYFRHPAYGDYPVVGVSWKQAQDYCVWRTDRVNEMEMEKAGFKKKGTPLPTSGDATFNTEAYLAGLVEVEGKKKKGKDGQERNLTVEDGILLPSYRLPTEAEWEFAALALVGNAAGENIEDRKIYPWAGKSLRDGRPGKTQGQILANFKRGPGDYMGIAGRLNDQAAPTAPVYQYYPNDYGLYNMAGNVNEWVQDLYRPLSFQDVEDFNSFRGNVFMIPSIDANGVIARDTSYGNSRILKVPDTVRMINPYVLDVQDSAIMYSEKTSLVNNRSRVYKGGGWRDMPYWLNPGTRRFLDENQSADDIGFRCAMLRMGSPTGKKGKKSK